MKKEDKITIVMATYKRNDFLSDKKHPALNLAKNDLIDKIVIVWQNVEEEIPKNVIENLEEVCKGKYYFEFPKKNSMNNRFKNYESIETNFVMCIDDDYNATLKSVKEMHNLIMSDKEILVGCVPRMITTNEKFEYSFKPEKENAEFNFILLGYSLFHKRFLDLYNADTDALLKVDELFNADDIYFNYMHEKYSKSKNPKALVSDLKVNTWKRVPGTSISDNSNHLEKRKTMCNFLEEKGYKTPRRSNRRVSLNHLNIEIKNAYWINLEKSKNRRELFQNDVINKLSNKLNFIRFPGLDLTSENYVGRRSAGCSFSHLSCWRDAINRKIDYIVVFEDDFNLTVSSSEFEETIDELIKNHPDFLICNLAYNRIPNENDKVLETGFFNYNDIQTTSAYIAKVEFLKIMYPYIADATMNLLVGGETRINAIDRAWKIFQNDERWLCSKKMGVQRSLFSEIERKTVDYKA